MLQQLQYNWDHRKDQFSKKLNKKMKRKTKKWAVFKNKMQHRDLFENFLFVLLLRYYLLYNILGNFIFKTLNFASCPNIKLII